MDDIGAMLSAPEWDTEMLDDIAHLVASTGRPHPGEPKLTDAEFDAIEKTGQDINAAAREAYEKCLGPVRVGSVEAGGVPEAGLGAPMFACHKSAEGKEIACAGWLAVEGHDHLGVRLAVARGRIPVDVLQPKPGWPGSFGSYDEMDRAQGSPHQGAPPW